MSMRYICNEAMWNQLRSELAELGVSEVNRDRLCEGVPVIVENPPNPLSIEPVLKDFKYDPPKAPKLPYPNAFSWSRIPW